MAIYKSYGTHIWSRKNDLPDTLSSNTIRKGVQDNMYLGMRNRPRGGWRVKSIDPGDEFNQCIEEYLPVDEYICQMGASGFWL